MGVDPYKGLGIGSAIFVGAWLVIGIPLAFYVLKRTKDRTQAKDNCWMAFWLTFMALFSCWIMWACTLMHQINPLIRPMTKPPGWTDIPTDWGKYCVNMGTYFDCNTKPM